MQGPLIYQAYQCSSGHHLESIQLMLVGCFRQLKQKISEESMTAMWDTVLTASPTYTTRAPTISQRPLSVDSFSFGALLIYLTEILMRTG